MAPSEAPASGAAPTTSPSEPTDPATAPADVATPTEDAEPPAPAAGTESSEPSVPEPTVPPTEVAPAGDAATEPPSELEAAPPRDDVATPAADAEIDPNLLDAEPSVPVSPRATAPRYEDPDDEAAALKAAYNARYRPQGNPTKINVVARALFTNMGGNGIGGGRMGGARVDVGPQWNQFVVAATLSGWGGKVLLPAETGAELNGLIGAGPTVGLGRLALVGRGFLDLRLGYDFMYGVVGARADQATVLASQSDPNVTLTQTQNLLPHGPRVTLDLGLVGDTRGHRYFQGFGASMGWQGLVGSLRGDLPFTNMLTLGLVYWFG